jgi:hypothetical protein
MQPTKGSCCPNFIILSSAAIKKVLKMRPPRNIKVEQQHSGQGKKRWRHLAKKS